MRKSSVGYGETLGEVIISEGLADHFDFEIYGRTPPWTQALSKEELKTLASRMKAEWNTTEYDHRAWFFGSGDLPNWTGYRLGFKLISDYLVQHPDQKASFLWNALAEEFKFLQDQEGAVNSYVKKNCLKSDGCGEKI